MSFKSLGDKLAKTKTVFNDDSDDTEEIGGNEVTQEILFALSGMGNGSRRRGKPVPVEQPANAVIPADDGTLQYLSFRLTPIGLQSSGENFEDWMQLGRLLRQIEGSLQWLIGDWVVKGEYVYNQTYDQIAVMTGYEMKTLYEYAYVARQIDFSIRMENLSFGHHQAVAALEPDQQQYWLEQASAGQWSISRLRKAMRPDTEPTKRDSFASFVASQIRDVRRLDRPALESRVNQLEELLTQMKQELNRKPR